MKEFHTLVKMQLHLRNSGRCRRDLWARGHLFQPSPGIGSTLSLSQSLQHDGALPPQQAGGPSRHPVQPRDLDGARHDLTLALVDAIMDKPASASLETALRTAIQSTVISWTQCSETLQTFAEQIDHEFAEIAQIDVDQMRVVVLRLARPSAWPFLHDVHASDCGPDDPLEHFELWCASLSSLPTSWRPTPRIDRAVSRDRIILHEFAGRRRIGDYQWYVDHLCGDSAGFLLHVVSVDIVIDQKYGDLSDPAIQAFWINGIMSGWVQGFLGGPPCATWSRARSVQSAPVAARRLPRPVRSASQLWGLSSLALRELATVSEGNDFLGFCLEAMTALAVQSMTGILEHPAEPPEEEFPSIWKLPIVQLLLSLPGAQRVKFAQGLMGASSPKATELFVLNLPDLLLTLHTWRVTADLPKGCSIGRRHNGEFCTAHLKEYPPALCAAFAQCTVRAMHQMATVEEAPVDAQFLHQCKLMVSRDFGSHIGHDHVR